MDLIKIGADTQVSTVPCFIKMLVLDNATATVLALYNEADASHTAATKRFSMRTTAEKLYDYVIFPGRGLRFETACHIDWTAGDVYYAVG